jgi:hypothetical protein
MRTLSLYFIARIILSFSIYSTFNISLATLASSSLLSINLHHSSIYAVQHLLSHTSRGAIPQGKSHDVPKLPVHLFLFVYSFQTSNTKRRTSNSQRVALRPTLPRSRQAQTLSASGSGWCERGLGFDKEALGLACDSCL